MKKITVKELIEILKSMPEDAIIMTHADEGDVAPVYEVYSDNNEVYIDTL